MPPYIEDICYRLYVLMSELIKRCVIPFCGILAVVIILLIVFGVLNRQNNK